jgi:cytochrome oxidase Cu insertion factor (SCO1/SenC/PrrC family)
MAGLVKLRDIRARLDSKIKKKVTLQKMPERNFVIAGAAVFILGVSVAAGIALKHKVVEPKSESTASNNTTSSSTAESSASSARPLVQFTMNDPAGRVVTDANFHGHWTMFFFGYANCPDVCPLSLLYATDLLKDLGLLANSLQIVFVTVDPGRDTDDVLVDYMGNFDSRIVALRGTKQQTADIAKKFGVYYSFRSVIGTDTDEYAVEHSNAFYLVDPTGRLQRAFALKQDQGGAFLNKEIRTTIFTTPKD